MLKINVPHHYAMFRHVVFTDSLIIINSHELHKQYILITVCNLIYNKLSPFILKKINKFFLKSFSPHWVRVSFRGKGFRLRKFKALSKLTLNFGHSHWARLALNAKFFFFKKLKRQNYLCIVKTFAKLKFFKKNIKTFKTLNSYTKRGLRLKKQFIRRRFGKISQVVSSLH